MTNKIKDLQIVLFSSFLVFVSFILLNIKDYYDAKTVFDNLEGLKTFSFEELKSDALKYVGDGNYRATDSDPKIIIENPGKVCNVKFEMNYYTYPGEVVVYYKVAGQEDYNEKNKVIAKPDKENNHIFYCDLKPREYTEIRIDPTIYRGNRLKFENFVFNVRQPIYHYLTFTADTVFKFVIFSGVLSSVFKLIYDFLTKKVE